MTFALGSIGIPIAALAADFQPIVPLGDIDYSRTDLTFGAYLNEIFKLSLTIGAVLAVIMLVYGGFEYMTGTKAGDKKSGLDRIRNAIIGLVLLLSVYIVLFQINPCILQITVFTNTTSDGRCSPDIARQGPDPTQRPGAGTETGVRSDQQIEEDLEQELGVNVDAIPEGSCLVRIGGTQCATAPVAVCERQNRIYTPQVAGPGTCAEGYTPRLLCNSGCPSLIGYPYDLRRGTLSLVEPTSCQGGGDPIPVCADSDFAERRVTCALPPPSQIPAGCVHRDSIPTDGTRPGVPPAECGLSDARVLRYFCPQ